MKTRTSRLKQNRRASIGCVYIRVARYDPCGVPLPLEIPLSATGIAADTLLRLMAVYSVVGPKRLPIFMSNAAEVYVETAVFIGLEYKEVMERYRERLLPQLADTKPYFFPFKRVLVWASR